LGDEEDTRRAIAAAKRAFASFGRTTKKERIELLRNLHKAVASRIDDLTNTMIDEYGAPRSFAKVIVESGAAVFLAAGKALEELPLSRRLGKTTVTLEPVGVAGVITPWNANAFFLCMKLSSALAAGCTVVMKPSELSSLQTQAWLQASMPMAGQADGEALGSCGHAGNREELPSRHGSQGHVGAQSYS
jgi:aldehyde dehydrogenase (NAD+)